MERPVDAKIVIRREDDMLVVSVPEVWVPGTKPDRPVSDHRIGYLVALICAGILLFTYADFGIAISVFPFTVLPLLILFTWSYLRKTKEPPSEPYQKSAAMVFRKDYFIATDTTPDNGRYFYVREHVPFWGDVCPYHDILYAVYIPCRYEGETLKEGEVCGSCEIICRSPEEAQWVLREIEMFLNIRKAENQ